MARKAVSGQASLIRDIKRQKTLVRMPGGGGSGSGTLHDAFSLDATVGQIFDLSGQALNIDVGAANGDIIHVTGGNLTYLTKGADGEVLLMAAGAISWGGGYGTGITDISLAASAEGTDAEWARTDHVHTLDESIAPTWTSNHAFDENIIMGGWQAAQTIESDDYVSQTTGWAISYGSNGGDADFRYIFADEMWVKAFIMDTTMALAGSIILTKSRAKLSRDFTIPDTGLTEILYVEDHEGLENVGVFAVNDYVLLRVIDHSGGGLVVANVYGQVTVYNNLSGGEQSWVFTTMTEGYSSAHIIHRGSVALDYGQTGSGSTGVWTATVLDAAGSPYSQVTTWDTITSGEPSNFTTHVRIGNLDGIAGIGLEYGLWAGQGAIADGDAFLLLSDSSAELHNIPLEIHDGSNVKIRLDAAGPYMSVGTVAPTGYYAADGFWVGNDGGTYKMSVGSPTAEAFLWDGSNIFILTDGATYLQMNAAGLHGYSNSVETFALTTGGTFWVGAASNQERMQYDTTNGLQIYNAANTAIMKFPTAGNAQIIGTLDVANPGVITAGGGEVSLDADGLTLVDGTATVNKVKWNSGSLGGAQLGYVTCDWAGGGGDPVVLWLTAIDIGAPSEAQVILNARPAAGTETRFVVESGGGIIATLGDAAGVNSFFILDSGGASQWTCDSNGNMYTRGTLKTTDGVTWDFGAAAGGTITPNCKIYVKVAGVAYWLDAQTA